jgi:hypothetical protein
MLENEIEEAQRLVKTDAYQMSVGEIVNMYKDGELIINPDFQRLFRWSIGQKSKLIESLLLGIPLPSIFVFERDDSKWELIDGLQRMSTILEFLNELKDSNTGGAVPPSVLDSTKYLPSLYGTVWEKSDFISDIPIEEQNPLTSQQKLAIKRSRLSVEILKRPSDNETKYDLFQRLNAGGTSANPQEIRNCIVIMVNKEYARFLRSLAEFEPFLNVVSLSEDQLEKQKHLEYVSRFLVYSYITYDGKLDVEEYIDDGIIKLASENEVMRSGEAFRATFTLLYETFGRDALRRHQDGLHSGRVGLAAFECVAVGTAKNITSIQERENPIDFVRNKVLDFWTTDCISDFFTSGLRGTVRIQRTIPFGARWFSHE